MSGKRKTTWPNSDLKQALRAQIIEKKINVPLTVLILSPGKEDSQDSRLLVSTAILRTLMLIEL